MDQQLTKAYRLGKDNALVSKKARNKILRENGLEPHTNCKLTSKFIEGQEFSRQKLQKEIWILRRKNKDPNFTNEKIS